MAQEELVTSFWNARPSAETQRDASFVQEEGVYYAARIRADEVDRTRAELSGVLIYRDDGTLLSAQSGTWDSVGADLDLGDRGGSCRLKRPPAKRRGLSYPLTWRTTPLPTWPSQKRSPWGSCGDAFRVRAQRGRDLRDDLFNFHQRLADAFSAFIFVLVASALGLHIRGRSAGFAWTIVLIVLLFRPLDALRKSL